MSVFYGDNIRWFIGIVEDNMNDPLKLGRVRVRAFGIHSPFLTDIPTDDLPWATIMVSATEGGISGVGRSPTGIEQGAWVFGVFMDGETSQNPLIMGTLPKMELPQENINPLQTLPGAVHGDVEFDQELRGASNAEKTFNGFVDNGFNDTVAAAVVGSLATEANLTLNPALQTLLEADVEGLAQRQRHNSLESLVGQVKDYSSSLSIVLQTSWILIRLTHKFYMFFMN